MITKFKIENSTEVPDEAEAEKIKEFFKRLGTLEGIKTSASEKYLSVDTSLEIDLKVLKYSDMKESFVPAIRNLAEYFLMVTRMMQRMKKRVTLSSLVSLFKQRNNETK